MYVPGCFVGNCGGTAKRRRNSRDRSALAAAPSDRTQGAQLLCLSQPRQLEMSAGLERKSRRNDRLAAPRAGRWDGVDARLESTARAWSKSGDRVSTPRTEPTDEELMTRFQSGERSSLGLLVRRHKTRLYNFALWQVGAEAAAAEVIEKTFVRVVQRAADFRHTARFSTWLYSMARDLCIDPMRNGSRHPPHPSLEAPELEEGVLEERSTGGRAKMERAASSFEIRDRVLLAVQSLPADQREVFLLREMGGLSFKEIAEIVGVSENTIKSRMRYGLERLQAALSEFEEYARALR